MKRRFEVEVRGTVTLEVDDEARSAWKPDQGILTAHEDPERFIPGSTFETTLSSLAVIVGINGRDVSRTDGWADFPERSVESVGWPDWSVDWWQEVSAPATRDAL